MITSDALFLCDLDPTAPARGGGGGAMLVVVDAAALGDIRVLADAPDGAADGGAHAAAMSSVTLEIAGRVLDRRSSKWRLRGPPAWTVVVAPGQPPLYEPGPIELLVRELTERGVARQAR